MADSVVATPTALVPAQPPAVGGEFMVKVTNLIYRLESSLYSLYQIFSAPVYNDLTGLLPQPVKNVLNKIGNILDGIVAQIRTALASKYMEQGIAILEATDQLLEAAGGLVPDNVAAVTDKVRNFMQLIIGLVKLGKPHVSAVLDLFSAVVNCAVGNTANVAASTLDPETVTTIQAALMVFPVPASVLKLHAAKDSAALEGTALVEPEVTPAAALTGASPPAKK